MVEMSNVRGGRHQDGIADLRTCAVVKVPISLLPASTAVGLIASSGVVGVVSSFKTAVAIRDPCLIT